MNLKACFDHMDRNLGNLDLQNKRISTSKYGKYNVKEWVNKLMMPKNINFL